MSPTLFGVGIRIGGRIGPVSVSTSSRSKGGGVGCLAYLVGIVALWLLLTWPMYVWHRWAVEIPYLVVTVGLVTWGWIALVRYDRRKHG